MLDPLQHRPDVQQLGVTPFGDRLAAAFAERGHLCVGIDPHPWLLEAWELPDDARGVRDFGLRAVEAAAGQACAIKPQVAFFERHGATGYSALEAVLAEARDAGLIVIADAKRGDVGSTVEAYGRAWLSIGSPLEADAMTVSAYQGAGSLDAVRALATAQGKGLFVLAATSNPESFGLQQAIVPGTGETVAAAIAHEVSGWNHARIPGSFGLVLGATVELGAYGIDPHRLAGTPVLAPGFGHQGARFSDIRRLFGPLADTALVSVSRSVLQVGPERLAEAVRRHSAEVSECLA
ncbi:orotidine-5'-phosphate decarboxylase [Ruicaihuangia caeni]|uniref:Orotidine-5'-phosphate decarboxylase n=1 Tax=Ruicaihuangia caeni TaxID=3042517 RepID=A0AAW6T6W0_9MICO|nr:orotidine-5'-phosphate decarboxylase [Klugiella sp. YN-L-19]MDI2098074.1 orotidine-5'-phosphate decarboxylase [Klugiella sp. YN-L-19]